jgi:excisionase family DNA binding protein
LTGTALPSPTDLTVREVAEKLRCTTKFVYNLIERQELAVIKYGQRFIRIPPRASTPSGQRTPPRPPSAPSCSARRPFRLSPNQPPPHRLSPRNSATPFAPRSGHRPGCCARRTFRSHGSGVAMPPDNASPPGAGTRTATVRTSCDQRRGAIIARRPDKREGR